VHRAWEETRRFAQALEAKVIVFQCPPSFSENLENVGNMIRFFKSEGGTEFHLAWEPRGGWSDQTIKALCCELGLIHCVDPMEKMPLYGEPQYFRLHGGLRYQHHYSEEELERLQDKVKGKDTYILFNNVNMYHDALTFDRLVKGRANDP